MDRYALYGVLPEEHDSNPKAMTLEEQQISQREGETLIYETDDYDEARAIFDAGGFERSGQWHVVTRVEDRVKNPPSNAPSKESYQ